MESNLDAARGPRIAAAVGGCAHAVAAVRFNADKTDRMMEIRVSALIRLCGGFDFGCVQSMGGEGM